METVARGGGLQGLSRGVIVAALCRPRMPRGTVGRELSMPQGNRKRNNSRTSASPKRGAAAKQGATKQASAAFKYCEAAAVPGCAKNSHDESIHQEAEGADSGTAVRIPESREDEGAAAFEELERRQVQMDLAEAKLSKMLGELELLRAKNDSLARTRRMLETEERQRTCRLERLNLLVQLRALQQTRPWAVHVEEQKQDEERERDAERQRVEARQEEKRLAREQQQARKQEEEQALKAQERQRDCAMCTIEKDGQTQPAHATHGQGSAVSSADLAAPMAPVKEGVLEEKGARAGKEMRTAGGEEAARREKKETQKPNGGAKDEQAIKKRRIDNPMGFLCKFALHGQCRDPACTDIHVEPPDEPGCKAATHILPSGTLETQRTLESESATPSGSERLDDAEVTGGGSVRPEIEGQIVAQGEDCCASVPWGDFIAISPLPLHMQRARDQDENEKAVPRALELESPLLGEKDSSAEHEQAAVLHLEQEWRLRTEDRYFGPAAQLAAARELAARDPANVAAWLSLASLLLHDGPGADGGGSHDADVCRDLALNALSDGLDANPTSVPLWLAYLEIVEAKDLDEAKEMTAVAVQKEPLDLRLWQRLAGAEISVPHRLAVWQQAQAKAAVVIKGGLPSQCQDKAVMGGEGMQALNLWVQAHVAVAATLALAQRSTEASHLLFAAADEILSLLGLRDGHGLLLAHSDLWGLALSVVETLSVLAVHVLGVCGVHRVLKEQSFGLAAASLMIGKTPSSLFPGGWQGSQIILRGWGTDEGEENTVNLSPLARVWTSGAVWLHSVAVGGATKATTEVEASNREESSVLEAIEHAFHLCQSCAAAAERPVDKRTEEVEGIVSPALAGQYVSLLRRASPLRGASTAQARLLGIVARHNCHQCDSRQECRCLRGWEKRLKVVMSLVRDAILTHLSHLSVGEPWPIGPALGGEDSQKICERMVKSGAGDRKGELVVLHGVLQGLCCLHEWSEDTGRMARLQAAATGTQACYWRSRLALTATHSLQAALDAISPCADFVRLYLGTGSQVHQEQRNRAGAGDNESVGSAAVLSAIGKVLSEPAGQEVVIDAMDRAEEELAWWLGRSYLWAVLLEAMLARPSASKYSAEELSGLLSKALAKVREMEESHSVWAQACVRCADRAATSGSGCWHLEQSAGCDSGRLCRGGLLPLVRAAICSSWLHNVLYPQAVLPRQVRSDTECAAAGLTKPAFFEVAALIRSGILTGGSGGEDKLSVRGWRRWCIVVAAWEAVVLGDASDAFADGAVHTPGLLQVMTCLARDSAQDTLASGLEMQAVGFEGIAKLAEDASNPAHPAHVFCGALTFAAAGLALHVCRRSHEDLCSNREALARIVRLLNGLRELVPDVRGSERYWLLLLHLNTLGEGAATGFDTTEVLHARASLPESAALSLLCQKFQSSQPVPRQEG